MPKPGKLPEEPKAPKDPIDPDLIYAFKVNGVRYELHGDWPWGAENELRTKTNMGFLRILLELQLGNPGKDIVGHLMWLSMLESGEQITLDEAQAKVNYKSDWVIPERGKNDYTEDADDLDLSDEVEVPLDPAAG